ncbi:MAG: MBL fold metallo-hydrolase [Paracoccaceae bacterium]
MAAAIQIQRNIRLIRAANPSPLTGSGTNTYLLGHGDVTVIDPGPDLDSHLSAILNALSPGERITGILLTHAHLDHSALIPRLVAETDAPTYGFGTAHSGRSPIMQDLAAEGLTGGEGADTAFNPGHLLGDGAILALSGQSIEVLHTPGHMGCHLSFAVGDLLFSGDHVMEWSTTMVSPPDGDMTDYMASLRRLAARKWRRFLPGHGEPVEAPADRLAALITHRLMREAAILATLQSHGPASASAIAALVYRDTPPTLLPAAARNVLAHLIDLSSRNAVMPDLGPYGALPPSETTFRLV